MDLKINEMADFLPKHWTPSNNYEEELYILVELDESSDVFQKIEANFPRCPLSIKRIQHPIAYLRYLVHTEYLNETKEKFSESIYYMPINKRDIKTYINYNCDTRYIKNNKYSLCSNATDAWNVGTDVIMVNKRKTTHETDKNYYPLYLIEF